VSEHPHDPPSGFVALDGGRLLVRGEDIPSLTSADLMTFDAWFQQAMGEEVRRIGARSTTRIPMGKSGLPWEVYLKRFQPLGWKERVKNWLSLKSAHHGARPEFDAALRFHQLGISSIEPLIFGESRGRSLLVTRGLTGYRDVKELLATRYPGVVLPAVMNQLAESLGILARTMHTAGLHHQDFYLNHILVRVDPENPTAAPEDLRIIDLGRVCERHPLAFRWVLKDLSQLNYSAALVPLSVKIRFLRTYLGRRLKKQDRRWIRRLLAKSDWIDRHTRRHRL